MNYKHEQLLPEERRLLFALNKEDPEEGHKIGHVRGDFDRNGTGFFTTDPAEDMRIAQEEKNKENTEE